jgi:exo-rhamnogalacturonan lyase-like protein
MAVVRRDEPVTVGVPCPRAWCTDADRLRLRREDHVLPLQARVLDRWSDGSIRWVLLDFRASVERKPRGYSLDQVEDARTRPSPLPVSLSARHAVVDTGAASFELHADGTIECRIGANAPPLHGRFQLLDANGERVPVAVDRMAVEETGSIRTCLLVEARAGDEDSGLRLTTRFHFFSNATSVRIETTLRNTRRAQHAGGFWDLGDAGSHYFKEWAFGVTGPFGSERLEAACSPELGAALQAVALPFEIYQDSSGGEHWRSSNHVNRNGIVPVAFRGYRVRSSHAESSGLRATPTMVLRSGRMTVSVSKQWFWQRFPKAMSVSNDGVVVGLLPSQYADIHELQGGEQITEECVV